MQAIRRRRRWRFPPRGATDDVRPRNAAGESSNLRVRAAERPAAALPAATNAAYRSRWGGHQGRPRTRCPDAHRPRPATTRAPGADNELDAIVLHALAD